VVKEPQDLFKIYIHTASSSKSTLTESAVASKATLMKIWLLNKMKAPCRRRLMGLHRHVLNQLNLRA